MTNESKIDLGESTEIINSSGGVIPVGGYLLFHTYNGREMMINATNISANNNSVITIFDWTDQKYIVNHKSVEPLQTITTGPKNFNGHLIGVWNQSENMGEGNPKISAHCFPL